MNNRLQNLRAKLPLPEQALLVTHAINRRYLSGFDGSAGWLLVTPEKHYIITDGRYWDQVEKQCPDAVLFRYLPKEHKNLSGALLQLLKGESLLGPDSSLQVETDSLSLSLFRELSLVFEKESVPIKEVSGLGAQLRECKDEAEIELLQEAARIADQALTDSLGSYRPGMTERELKAELEYNILRHGGNGPSFGTIVASGPNGSLPHAGASDRVIGERELITVDFGANFRGYCSDMTRTIWFGELPAEERRILSATREAQEKAVAAVKAGICACDLDRVARRCLEEAELSEFFVHSLGHGVGLEIHESPGLRDSNKDELKVGQVVTIEPGVYLPGQTGCRVEDTVVVTQNGCRILNKFPKQALDAISPLPRE